MKHLKTTLLALAVAAVAGSSAMADCGIDAGRVNIVGNEFPAIQSVMALASACAGATVTISANLTAAHETVNLPGMTGNPAEYTGAVVASSSVVALMNGDVLRPLDDLIAQFGQDISPSQLIRINGQVMAVAFMANAQHLVYRADVLEPLGIAAPTSYEEMLAAAEAIRAAGVMQYPIIGTYKAGWNLGEEFVNMYLGMGGEFFVPGTAQVAINNAQGLAALEMMRTLSGYMNPDFLTYDSNAVTAEWQAGNAALSNFWGSRMAGLQDAALTAAPEIAQGTMAAAAPTVAGGSIPATSLWWDGWTVARNVSDADAAATFRAMAHGSSAAVLTDASMTQAVWMVPGYQPTAAAAGVTASIQGGAMPYPMLPYMGLMHTALGDNLADFLQGTELPLIHISEPTRPY